MVALFARRYALGAQLSAGELGSVFAAVDRLSGRPVIVKRISSTNEQSAARAQREVATLRSLSRRDLGPGVVRLLDDAVFLDEHWIVLERVEGQHFPGLPSPCSWSELERPLCSLLKTLSRVHAAGFVHADIKPSNIIVDRAGRATLVDWGVATHVGASWTSDSALFATPAFAAPERYGAEATASCDLFSIGVSVFFALTGELPWRDDSRPEQRSARSLPALEAPRAVALFCEALLQREPSQRPSTALAALAMLSRARHPRAASAARKAVDDRPWRGPPSGASRWNRAKLSARIDAPERLLHVRSDASALLLEHSRGTPALVEDLVGRWIRDGIATVAKDKLVLTAESFATLRAWSEAERSIPSTPTSWIAHARRLAVEGRLSLAEPYLREAIHYASAPPTQAAPLLAAARLWLRVAFAARDESMIDRWLLSVQPVITSVDALRPLEALARSYLATRHWTLETSSDPRSIAPFRAPAIERLRLGLCIDVARRSGGAQALRAELATIERRKRRSADAAWISALALWRGRALYVEEEYRSSALHFERSARGESWRSARLNALLNAASAWMEAFSFARARAIAAEIRSEARDARLAFFEARAEWVWRSASDRAGVRLDPDLALVEAAAALGAPDIVVMIALTEATIAFRREDRRTFRALASIARSAAGIRRESLAMTLLAALEVALAITSRRRYAMDSPRALAARGLPRMALEVASLLGDRAKDPAQSEWFISLARTVAARHRDRSMGVFSANECLRRLLPSR